MLRLGSQPAANAAIDESDDATIERLVQTFAQQFPSVCDGSAEMGIPGVAPTKLHPDGVRDTSYHGHSFDSFYYRKSDAHALSRLDFAGLVSRSLGSPSKHVCGQTLAFSASRWSSASLRTW